MNSSKMTKTNRPTLPLHPFADRPDDLTTRAKALAKKDAEFAARIKALEDRDKEIRDRIKAAQSKD